MTAVDSIFDLDVAVRNMEFLQLLSHQRTEFVKSFCVAALAHERGTVLRSRVARYEESVASQFSRIPALASRAPVLAAEWAAYRFGRDAGAIRAIMKFGNGATSTRDVEVVGVEHVHAAGAGGRPILFVSAHLDVYQALATALAAFGHTVTVLMDGHSRNLGQQLHEGLAPRLATRVTLESAQDWTAVRRFVAHIRSGSAGLLFPEFGRTRVEGSTVQFLGRRVLAPQGGAVIARLARAALVPVLLKETADGYSLTFEAPLWTPGDIADRAAVTARVFRWLEAVVSGDPGRWWCWEIFESLMSADPVADHE